MRYLLFICLLGCSTGDRTKSSIHDVTADGCATVVPDDLMTPDDLSQPDDLSMPADLAMIPPDMTALPDLAMIPPDLAIPPDMTVLPDMSLPPDLMPPPWMGPRTYRRVLPIGDSTTGGGGACAPGAWRPALWQLAETGGVDLQFVGSLSSGAIPAWPALGNHDHEGHDGWDCLQLLNDLKTRKWVTITRPQIVLLSCGFNDKSHGYSDAVTSQHQGQLLDEIILQAPTAKIVINTLSYHHGAAVAVVNINNMLPAMLATRPGVLVADVASVIDSTGCSPTVYSSGNINTCDCIHPNPLGNQKWAAVVWEFIKP